MDFGKAFTSTFENMDVLSAIASTIAIILLGFIMRKRGIFTETVGIASFGVHVIFGTN